MNILLINAAWDNRGDESAIRAMVDEFRLIRPNVKFNILNHLSNDRDQFPYSNDIVVNSRINYFTKKNFIDIPFLILSRGKFALMPNTRQYIKILKDTDFVLHAPGGPSMGELYPSMQFNTFFKFIIAALQKKPFGFYAPSMGPFEDKFKNILRKYIYKRAKFIATREDISAQYYKALNLEKKAIVTADSAIQHKIDEEKYSNQLREYTSLSDFLDKNEKVIGITITELDWHSIHNNQETKENIKNTFNEFISYLKQNGCAVVFIPQLFGKQNDYDLMSQYMQENCFIVDDQHDCYFQQYLISKLHAVVGLRYHSNIFSAKMMTPFISISYEQKMSGFIKLCGMQDYCIELKDLSPQRLIETFEKLEKNHSSVKQHLVDINPMLIERSSQTTKLLCKYIDEIEKND